LYRELLQKLRRDALVIDLASKPGGDDCGDRKINRSDTLFILTVLIHSFVRESTQIFISPFRQHRTKPA
jgi:hypothetical protein